MLEFSRLLRMKTVLVAWQSISAATTKQLLFKLLQPTRGLSISDVGERACISMDDIVGTSRLDLCTNLCKYGCFIACE
jgi:hypothetical protein